MAEKQCNLIKNFGGMTNVYSVTPSASATRQQALNQLYAKIKEVYNDTPTLLSGSCINLYWSPSGDMESHQFDRYSVSNDAFTFAQLKGNSDTSPTDWALNNLIINNGSSHYYSYYSGSMHNFDSTTGSFIKVEFVHYV